MADAGEFARQPVIISVSELNLRVRQHIERGFPLMWVGGEISNFVRATSEHWYFSLKDAKAQVRCAMFRNRNQLAEWIPGNGDAVEVQVLVTLYEARGEYQLIVESIRRAGLGALFEKFLKLKSRLEAEGLFDVAKKRALPEYPKQIGVITSPAAAALRDVLTTLKQRAPNIPVVLYPAGVQGNGAAAEIVNALRVANQRAECDVLILCRGGGSIEDLWPFNEESVARAVAASGIPIVSGVGHETDFTIADFVADERAPTPTAAAQRAASERDALLEHIADRHGRIAASLHRALQARAQHLDHLARRLVRPGERLRQQRQHLAQLALRLSGARKRFSESHGWQLQRLAERMQASAPPFSALNEAVNRLVARHRFALKQALARRAEQLNRMNGNLQHLNPARVLERGYSVVRNRAGNVVTDSAQISIAEQIDVAFARGTADVRVTHIKTK